MTENTQQSVTGTAQPASKSSIGSGLALLAALVVFVAFWMAYQGREALIEANITSGAVPGQLTGFRSDAWFLPDEPLLGFVEIPAGAFIMGSDPASDRQAYENERWSATQRQGSVELPSFFISRYEVTVAQYRVFAAQTSRQTVPEALAADPDHPVTHVTWTDALAYGRWLQSRLAATEETPAVIRDLLAAGWQVTLPTEAQWEKAARGSEGSVYPWGNLISAASANFAAGSTRPVGAFDCAACAHGLADMSGNVWELTRSPYQPYPYTTEDDRDNLSEDALWVMRGGSYADGAANVRTAVRGGVDPGVRNATIGFRLVISPE